VVVPEPNPVKVPLAYPLPPNHTDWAELVNNWIELKRRDGTIAALFRHWIMGQGAEPRGRRWSVVRNVLHWVN
jgi:ABC-type amino acid transport substrate-binding protein